MQSAYAMNSDIKALLTLWLLRMGTSPEAIQMTLQLAAASRIMVAEEQTAPDERAPPASNVAKLRLLTDANAAAANEERLNTDAMNSDVKALLSLALLKSGASSREIKMTLRLAAASRTGLDDENDELQQLAVTTEPVAVRRAGIVSLTPKQLLRNEHLAPISRRGSAVA
jgi:hypothetical protein